MDLILTRTSFEPCGIFGALTDTNGNPVAVTLEHAYPKPGQFFAPKVPFGVYDCVRGVHRLNGSQPFVAFEITRVPGCWGILFHIGNTNQDSSGCVLLGGHRFEEAILESRATFEAFMKLQEGVDQFRLTVR